MKKAIFLLLVPLYFHAYAQEQNDNSDVKKSFPKYKLFTGGSANLGFASGLTMIGLTPQFGMSLTDWMDAGVTFNWNYLSQSDPTSPAKINLTTYGPGAFVRLFPLNFLFATAQYEHNFMSQKYIPGIPGEPSQTTHSGASSLLLGFGYAGGRQKGGNTYYYMSLSWDVIGEANSPYVDSYGRSIVQFRVGYNIGLFQKQNR
ncbi:MAG TPA: hypothetical protein VIJ75_03115 [Hanamia sp.]